MNLLRYQAQLVLSRQDALQVFSDATGALLNWNKSVGIYGWH